MGMKPRIPCPYDFRMVGSNPDFLVGAGNWGDTYFDSSRVIIFKAY